MQDTGKIHSHSHETADVRNQRDMRSYFDNIHYSLPIVRQNLFLSQCRRLFVNPSANPGPKWLTIFYMILAIGSQFCQLSGGCQLSGQSVQDEASADFFFARARTLNDSENILYEHNDLQQLQAEALITFYLLSKAQINRAWKMVGIASRTGVALGLHLRRTNNDLDMEADEARKLLWWSIFYLEHLLASMTGRASCLTVGSISAPPPQPFEIQGRGLPDASTLGQGIAGIATMQWSVSLDADRVDTQQKWLRSLSPNMPLYFYYLLDLSVIAHAITNQVYTSRVLQDEPHEAEKSIKFFSQKLSVWLSGLNPSLAFEDHDGSLITGRTSRPQVSLALCYYSTRVMLHRRCLPWPIANLKRELHVPHSRFHEESASSCLRASMALVNILPDHPDLAWIYTIAPWWSIVHFLMQANIVLLSHISIHSVPAEMGNSNLAKTTTPFTPAAESPENVFDISKKALRWLHCLGSTNASSGKAFELCYTCIWRIASSRGLDLGDMHSLAKEPSSSTDPEQSSKWQTTPTKRDEREASGSTAFREKSSFDNDGDGDLLLRELAEGSTGSYLFPMHDADMDMAEFIFFDENALGDEMDYTGHL